MPVRLKLGQLIDEFDERVEGNTGAIGLVGSSDGEKILRALLIEYLNSTPAVHASVAGFRPRMDLDGRVPVLDDAIVVRSDDGRAELLFVEYKFWTSSSYRAKAIPKDAPVEESAWLNWHDGIDEWKGEVDRETFLGWKQAAKILGSFERLAIPAAYSDCKIRPVLCVWTPLLAQPMGAGVCWSEARLAGDWHKDVGYNLPLTVFSGSLFCNSRKDRIINTDIDPAVFGQKIRTAQEILSRIVE